jgi:predicted transcriptional regulator
MADSKSASKPRVRPRVTGLRFDRELVKEAKHLAVDTDRTLTEVIEQAMREYLGRRRPGAK